MKIPLLPNNVGKKSVKDSGLTVGSRQTLLLDYCLKCIISLDFFWKMLLIYQLNVSSLVNFQQEKNIERDLLIIFFRYILQT